MTDKILKNNKGLTIVEVLVACLVISITIFSLIFAASKGIELSYNAIDQTQSSYLLEEGIEAIKLIRDDDWNNINILISDESTKYYLFWNGGINKWELNTTPSLINGIFTREVIFGDVYRNDDDDIASSGTLDQDIKKVTVKVSFNSPSGVNENAISFYIANIFN
ncbi:TPA: hypothetical protein DIC38_00225 [Candidatus Nomurabacteria bacterium]|nr:MAG: hypothetical protein O210_OD1C00001G0682 [Parcubacteria bacterium RAAC4_OD1_1]HCY26102.1 hypothetical protein [Candidatus Nomurabacteria bacterium]